MFLQPHSRQCICQFVLFQLGQNGRGSLTHLPLILRLCDVVEGQHAVQCDIVFFLVILHRHRDAAAALVIVVNDP